MVERTVGGWSWTMVLVLGLPAQGQPPGEPPAPEEERQSLRLADPGLLIELVVCEPAIQSPVAIAWDEGGALFVAEMIDYPEATPAGRVKRLEDRDGDGSYERISVFAEGLPYPNGLLPWNGGVFVTAAPNLWYFRDSDGDGRAEERRVVLSGFAEGNQQLRANGLTWGLDNWVYGANGRSGGLVRRPDDPPEKGIVLARNDFRFRPESGTVEAVAGFSQFGLPRDDIGNRFPSWNTVPIRQVVLEERHLARNRFLASAETVASILDSVDGGRVYPIAPPPLTFNRESFGHFNASCGPTIYRGDLLPESYRGNAFVCEPLTSLVHRRMLRPDGAVFKAVRVEHGREFLAATHPWFRPVNLATGPDGALYVVDFCRALVEHPAFVPERQRAGVDFRAGFSQGRIWRIRPVDAPYAPRRPDLKDAPPERLVALLEHPNGWWRDTAQRLLVERRETRAVPALREAARSASSPLGRIHALWVLAGLDALDDEPLRAALRDGDARVREQALRLLEGRAGAFGEAILALADDGDARVRFRCALALGQREDAAALSGLARIAARDAADRWTCLAVLSGLETTAWPFLRVLLDSNRDWLDEPTAEQARLLVEAAGILGARKDERDLAGLAGVLEGGVGVAGRYALLAGLAEGLGRAGTRLARLSRESASWRRALDGLLSQARATAGDDRRPVETRVLALEALLGAGAEDLGDVVLSLLDPRQPLSLQAAAARGVGELGDAVLAARAVASWDRMTPSTRRVMLAALVRSGPLALVLLDAVEREQVPASEVSAPVREALVRHPAAGVRQRAERLFPRPAVSDRAAVVQRYEAALAAAGDRARGAAVFEKHCLTCHRRQERGHRVGPDLDGVAGRPAAALLVDILDPNREVAPDAISYVVVTRAGQVLDGLLVAETPTSVRLRRAEGAEETVLRSEVAELRATGRSLMPEGLEQSLSVQDLADLIALLQRPGP